jgi:hypothetical protein
MKSMLVAIGFLLLGTAAIITVVVESEGGYQHEVLGGGGPARALVLYHPSRDAHFSDELSMALARGLINAGFAVERATLTGATPAALGNYQLVAVVSNTYWWTPDRPTLRYLARVRLDGTAALGIIGGAGSTGRSQRLLDEALRKTGARVIDTRSFWIFRPNEATESGEPNRQVAMRLAERLGRETGRQLTIAAAGQLH